MRKRIVLPFLALTLLLAHSAVAQTLTLEDAVARALAYNRDVVASEYESKAAVTGLTEAVGHLLPRAEVQEIYLRSNNPVTAFGTDLNQGNFSLMEFQMSDPNEPDITEDYITRLTVEQPLFTGGRVSTGIYQATKMKQAAELTAQRTKRDVEIAVAGAYYNTLRAKKFVELTELVIKTTERHVKTASDYFASGMVLESEVLRAEVFLANAKVQNVEAVNRLALARAYLNYLLGEDQDRAFALVEPENLDCSLPELPELIGQALADRQDLGAMTKKVEVAQSQKVMAGTQFLPTVGLQAEYNFHDEDTLFGDQAEDWTMMIAAKWELFDGFKDASKTTRAVYEARAAQTRLQAMREGIALEVRQKFLELQGAVKKLKMAEASVARAVKTHEIIGNRYKSGLVKINDVLDAQTDEVNSRTSLLNATYDVILARQALRHAMGMRQCGLDEKTKEEE